MLLLHVLYSLLVYDCFSELAAEYLIDYAVDTLYPLICLEFAICHTFMEGLGLWLRTTQVADSLCACIFFLSYLAVLDIGLALFFKLSEDEFFFPCGWMTLVYAVSCLQGGFVDFLLAEIAHDIIETQLALGFRHRLYLLLLHNDRLNHLYNRLLFFYFCWFRLLNFHILRLD